MICIHIKCLVALCALSATDTVDTKIESIGIIGSPATSDLKLIKKVKMLRACGADMSTGKCGPQRLQQPSIQLA